MVSTDTIVALSSGNLPSGVAVIRLSGPQSKQIAVSLCQKVPTPRNALLSDFVNPESMEIIDCGLVLWFPGPASFTGEDCLEFHCHGGKAVVSAMLEILCSFEKVRIAEAGEFSRRAFENEKLDLTQAEGLADLIASETEAQRRQALDQSQGKLREIYLDWRQRLIHIRALIEAELDFAEEEDVPDEISQEGFAKLSSIVSEIKAHLDDQRVGEIIRDGYRIVLMGKPNAGKSSLLNMLAKRDVAIVTSEAGTTRDIIDVHLDIAGYPVIISDTAGIRETDNIVEKEGVARANERGSSADLVIWLSALDDQDYELEQIPDHAMKLISKDDEGSLEPGKSISSKTGYGIDKLLSEIGSRLESQLSSLSSGVLTRRRHRDLLEESLALLNEALNGEMADTTIRAENIRLAGDCIGKICGKIDVEDLLDVIFSEFCVGK